MKKFISLLLAFSLTLSLTACGGTKQSDNASAAPDASAADSEENAELQFALGVPLTKESEYTDDDGTVLLTVKYELPQLELHTADGALFELDSSAQADVCRTFNTEMQKVAEQFESSAQEETLEAAREAYAGIDKASQAEWTNYAEELTIGTTYQTDGLLSILGNGYFSGGGAHPTAYTRTWNFDLTTGEFITFDSLTGNNNPLGKTLSYALTSAIFDEIDEQGLSENYFDDYESSVDDLSTNANFYFQDSGMVVEFDVYVLAPYACGPQAFDISYDKFYYALDEHTQSLFSLPQDTVIVSDYLTTQVLWSWFNMSMPPLASDTPEITTSDGVERYRVALGNVNTLASLRTLLCRHVSEELADEWLSDGQFVEENGVLYISMGERGSDITIGSMEYSVKLDGDRGELTQTVHRQDFDTAGKAFLTGETDDHIYPFTLENGHAVFSSFPCPL